MNIILDFDGTIHDCAKIYIPAFRTGYKYLTDRRLAPIRHFSDSEISGWLGYSAKDMWDRFMPDLDEKYKKTCTKIIGDEMLKLIDCGKSVLYSGAEETLKKLNENGHKLIFLSNCGRSYMEAHINAHQLNRFFCDYFCTEDYDFRSKPEIFPYIKQKHPGKFIVIGDRYLDLETALKHSLKSIGCTYGYCKPQELDKADITVSDISQIPSAVEKFSD
ncbi:HAD family hydrolase [Porcipelethomonas sp.]|uniref:HAD family hydrolase n=1 Tax=Porcipelethomonas sp. TaxID=2981675 RepID=UPI003EF7C379